MDIIAATTLKASPIRLPHCCFRMSKATHARNDEPKSILKPMTVFCMNAAVFNIAAIIGNMRKSSNGRPLFILGCISMKKYAVGKTKRLMMDILSEY